MQGFILHARLQADCHLVGDLDLSRVLLLDDCRYPWVILVPRRPGVQEIYQLAPGDRAALIAESCLLGEFMIQAFRGDKLNLGSLGNLVPQLHLHHVVRYHDDPAWPGPVWGHSPGKCYPPEALAERLRRLREGLAITA